MENMGRINSLLDQLMLCNNAFADADSLGLLKPISDFMRCRHLQGHLYSMTQELLELEHPK